jgi:hypothetical protein
MAMKEEYNFTLTIPLEDIDEALLLLNETQAKYPMMRLSRKPDRLEKARFYLCFPFAGTRTDLGFPEWFSARIGNDWELFGPNYGVWGFV